MLRSCIYLLSVFMLFSCKTTDTASDVSDQASDKAKLEALFFRDHPEWQEISDRLKSAGIEFNFRQWNGSEAGLKSCYRLLKAGSLNDPNSKFYLLDKILAAHKRWEANLARRKKYYEDQKRKEALRLMEKAGSSLSLKNSDSMMIDTVFALQFDIALSCNTIVDESDYTDKFLDLERYYDFAYLIADKDMYNVTVSYRTLAAMPHSEEVNSWIKTDLFQRLTRLSIRLDEQVTEPLGKEGMIVPSALLADLENNLEPGFIVEEGLLIKAHFNISPKNKEAYLKDEDALYSLTRAGIPEIVRTGRFRDGKMRYIKPD